MKLPFVVLISLTLIFSITFLGCNKRMRFLVCPAEYADKMKSVSDLSSRKELLAYSDYRIVLVNKDENGKSIVVQHYRPEHTFGDNELPLRVSFNEPLHIGAIVIIDNPKKQLGVAIKRKKDEKWRIYWASIKDVDESSKTDDVGVLYLPPYESLPFIQKGKKGSDL